MHYVQGIGQSRVENERVGILEDRSVKDRAGTRTLDLAISKWNRYTPYLQYSSWNNSVQNTYSGVPVYTLRSHFKFFCTGTVRGIFLVIYACTVSSCNHVLS
jgi:hypothetical protein